MTNLWVFVLQTLYAALTGGLLLLVKALLQDKLTPRWQYGVWGVLALRILLPVRWTGKYILLPLPLWVEIGKSIAESGLESAYTEYDTPVSVSGILPHLTVQPVSLTDWLFVIYGAGVLFFFLRYLFSYLRLRRLLGNGTPAPQAVKEQIARVGEIYGLKPCKAVVLSGLPSPMVCGVLRPVLVLPEGEPVDDYVLLHELLHIRYHDAAQNLFWSVCRALHWCDPVVWYCIDRVGNDLESLCDQRVLERLAGEERRAYGVCLLTMANDRYPRAPGTTSVSNGGKNIARRIEAIVRFKRYPRGMALASVCVTVMLLAACFLGGVSVSAELPDNDDVYSSYTRSGLAFSASMAKARMARCTTAAGALDTFAKAMLYEDGRTLLMVTPKAQRPALESGMRQRYEAMVRWEETPAQSWFYRRLMPDRALVYHAYEDMGLPMEGSVQRIQYGFAMDYQVLNLRAEGDCYRACLAFSLSGVIEPVPYNSSATLLIPVRVTLEDGYVVEDDGLPILIIGTEPQFLTYHDITLPGQREYTVEGLTGEVTVAYSTLHTVKQEATEEYDPFFGGMSSSVSRVPILDARFDMVQVEYAGTYTFRGGEEQRSALFHAGVALSGEGGLMENASGGRSDLDHLMEVKSHESGSGNGSSWTSQPVDDAWDGTVKVTSGTYVDDASHRKISPPDSFTADIWLNGEHRETLTLREVTHDGP